MLQSRDTVSLGISIPITDPPICYQIHLQSHSCEVIEAGAGSSVSPTM